MSPEVASSITTRQKVDTAAIGSPAIARTCSRSSSPIKAGSRRLLKKHTDKYQVVFSDAEVNLEIGIKGLLGAVVRGAPGASVREKKIACGPTYIHFDEPTPVLSFLLDFEREWDNAWNEIKDPSKRNQAFVIDWLEQLIHKSAKK